MSGPTPPRKRLGQHFLTDPRILDRIADALAPRPDETIVEIGPGRGSLTDRLVPRCGRLIAIELDRNLAPMLQERYAARAHVEVVEADVLDVSIGALAGGPYALVGNVPYYITTPILFHALLPPRPMRAVFLVQREVAERVVAAPGSGAYGALSVNVQVFATAKTVFRVAAGAFTPPPRVESAVVRLDPLPQPLVPADAERRFSAFVQAVFAQRRKQLRSIVRGLTARATDQAEALLREAGFEPSVRPERLSPAEFVALFAALRSSISV